MLFLDISFPNTSLTIVSKCLHVHNAVKYTYIMVKFDHDAWLSIK